MVIAMKNYQLLAWDTEMLGVPTAKIIPERLTVLELKDILQELKSQKINLVFWASDSEDAASQQAAHEFSGFLADHKLTYYLDLSDFHAENFDLSHVESYREAIASPELYALAQEIAVFSRFGTDPKISSAQRTKVYNTWMDNSVKRQNAKEVLVIKQNNKVVGVTTLGEKNKRGDIGLLAVDPKCRGMQLGTKLVRASQIWCVKNGYRWAQVVTQRTNPAACALYEKCGFTIDKIEHFYHFWL